MRKYMRLFSFITLMMFVLNMVITQPLLATENASEIPSEEAVSLDENVNEDAIPHTFEASEGINENSDVESLTRSYGDEAEKKITDYSKTPLSEVDIFTGSSRYSIPINIPLGRNGLAPSLSLSYNSYNKNGWVGVGWNLEIGEIKRSLSKLRGLDYNAFDFEVTGPMVSGKVVTRNAASEWGPGYYGLKAEKDYTKFHNPSPSDTGWVVTSKDGKKYYYGTTNASRQFNTLGIFKWCLDKIEDTNGNTIEITYTAIEGYIYPSQILYTSVQTGFYNKIEFVLSQLDRPDNPISYSSKSKVNLNKRLESIKVYSSNNTILSKYKLTYLQGETSKRSVLTSFQKIGFENGVEVKFPINTFSYFNGERFNYSNIINSNVNYKQREQPLFTEINGDGLSDLIVFKKAWTQNGALLENAYLSVKISNGDSTFKDLGTITIPNDITNLHPFDWGNDGSVDLITIKHFIETKNNKHGSIVYTSVVLIVNSLNISNNGIAIIEKAKYTLFDKVTNFNQKFTFPPMDFNNDGFIDAVFTTYTGTDKPDKSTTTVNFWMYDIASDSYKHLPELTKSKTDKGTQNSPSRFYKVHLGDFKGTGWKTGIEFYPKTPGVFLGGIGVDDINSDGIDDITRFYTNKDTQIYLSDSNGEFVLSGYGNFRGDVNLTEINGDGITDVTTYYKNVNKEEVYSVYASTANGNFVPILKNHIVNVGDRYSIVDINGDGLSDIFSESEDNSLPKPIDERAKIYLAKGDGKADILKSVKNGHGGETHFSYKNTGNISDTYLPFNPYPVSSITIKDGNGGEKKYSYAYNGGFYNKIERDYRGFKKVTRTNPDNTTVETTFHQDKFLKGKKKSVVVKSNTAGTPEISRTTYTWEPIPETNIWGHLKLNKKETLFDGNTAYRTTDTYDRYNPESGQLEQMTVTGTRTNGSATDPIVHTYAYENLDTAGWMWRLKEETLTGRVDAVTPSGVVRKTSYTYYPTTNADGTFGDLQYEDHYSDTTSFIRTEYKYDSYGNVTSQIDPKGHITTFEYDLDTHTYPVKITNAKGHIVAKSWDYRFGVEKTITDENGHITSFTYDPFGRMIQSDSPDGGQTLIEYEDTLIPNWVKTRTKENATDFTESIEYFDGFGRSIQAVSKASPTDTGASRFIVSKTHYDSMGRAWLSTGPFYLGVSDYQNWSGHSQYPSTLNYHYTQTDFDAEGRPLKIESPEGQNLTIVTAFSYKGFDTTITDPDGNKKTEHKDHLGQIVTVTEHHPTDPLETGVTRYEYNAAGDLICVKNALWSETNDTIKTKTVITYDNLGRKEAMQDPDMGKWAYIYDANGNLKEQLDSKGQKSFFTYDEINRILNSVKHYPKEIHHAPEEVVYEYDETVKSINCIGRLYKIKNGTSLLNPSPPQNPYFRQAKTVYDSYDVMGRPLKVTKTIRPHGDRYTEYIYDLAGKTTEIAYPHAKNGKKFNVLYTFYPGTGLIKEVNSTLDAVAHKHFATLSNYTPVGKIGKVTYGNGVVTDYKYDDHSFRLFHIFTQKNAATGTTVLMDKKYYYFHSGDIDWIDDNLNVISRFYTYDHLHRLKTEESTIPEKFKAMDLSYVYDDANLTVPLHAPVNIKTLNKGVSKDHLYKYDENGNTTQSWDFRFPQNAVKRFIKNWTPDNMPKRVELGRIDEKELKSPVLFKYDGEGKRVVKSEKKKNIEENDHMYYYFAHYEVQERDNKSEGKRYIFAGNLRLARYLNGTHIAYFHKDHLGSTGATTDVNGKSTETTDYLPFGGNRSHTGTVHSDYKFTDQEKDAEIGLYNYDARLYDPMIGRFISADTLTPNVYNPQSMDRYAYTLNNPLNYTDPSGHIALCMTVAGGYALAKAVVFVGSAVIASKIISDFINKPKPIQSQLAETIDEGSDSSQQNGQNIGETGNNSTDTVDTFEDRINKAKGKIPSEWGDPKPNKKAKKGKKGYRWSDPENPAGNGVRIDKGDPNHNLAGQDEDHVVVRNNGKVIGRNGQPIDGSVQEDYKNSHIPLDEWEKWEKWNEPGNASTKKPEDELEIDL